MISNLLIPVAITLIVFFVKEQYNKRGRKLDEDKKREEIIELSIKRLKEIHNEEIQLKDSQLDEYKSKVAEMMAAMKELENELEIVAKMVSDLRKVNASQEKLLIEKDLIIEKLKS